MTMPTTPAAIRADRPAPRRGQRLTRAVPLLLLLSMAASAMAATAATGLAAYKQAGDQLTAMVASAEAGGKLAQLRTPAFERLVDVVADGDHLISSGPYPVDQVGTLLEICDVANTAFMHLVLFDLKSQVKPGTPPQAAGAAVMRVMADNNRVFQDELMKVQPFLFRCLAAEVTPITNFMLALKPEEVTEVRRQGLAQLRRGIFMMLTGTLLATRNTGLREDYRGTVLAALAQVSEALASVTPLSDRQRIVAMAERSSSGAAPAFQPHLEKIAASFRDQRCEGLCPMK